MKTNLLLTFTCLIALGLSSSLSAQTAPDEENHLLHVWDFEDGSADDLIGDANGTLLGDAFIDNGALEFQGADPIAGYVSIPGDIVAVNTYPELSVEIWSTPLVDGNGGGHNMLFYFGNTNSSSQGWNYLFYTPSKLNPLVGRAAISCQVEASPWTGEEGIDITEGYNDGTEIHSVVTISGTTMSLYVNDELIGTTEFAKPENGIAYIGTDSLLIGRGGYWGDNTWKGSVEKMAVYDVALTPENISWLYGEGSKHVYEATAIEKTQNNFKPFIYGTNGTLNFKNYNNAIINSVEVYNVVGNKVFSTNKFESSINVNLSPSLYIVKIESNIGVYQQKVYIK